MHSGGGAGFIDPTNFDAFLTQVNICLFFFKNVF
jgi:hypothetical protein